MATELYLRSVQFGRIALIGVIMVYFLGIGLRTGLKGILVGIVLYGIYAAFTVVKMAASFNSCTDAKTELTQEIEEARNFLSSKKVI